MKYRSSTNSGTWLHSFDVLHQGANKYNMYHFTTSTFSKFIIFLIHCFFYFKCVVIYSRFTHVFIFSVHHITIFCLLMSFWYLWFRHWKVNTGRDKHKNIKVCKVPSFGLSWLRKRAGIDTSAKNTDKKMYSLQ